MTDKKSERARTAAIARAVKWLTGMQCSNGGWAAFDWNNEFRHLAKIPFADFGELLDPPSVDVTAHVLEMYGRLGYSLEHRVVHRTLSYIWAEQEHDGPWFGRWGVNYIYGTAAVLPALASLGIDMTQPPVRRAVGWLLAHQNPGGGWGETCASYVDPSLRGQAESTPSQTSWALIALMSVGETNQCSEKRGCNSCWIVSVRTARGMNPSSLDAASRATDPVIGLGLVTLQTTLIPRAPS